jgi:putative colanic acid biosynthesis glycosyltransferase
MKLIQINDSVNTGSTGRIAEGIARVIQFKGHESYIAYGREHLPSESTIIKIGNKLGIFWHGIKSRLFDLHGFGSTLSTITFVKKLKKTDPDIIHLHNIHGYYLNILVLFNYLKLSDKPIVWTLHDCWPFTGHCSYFDAVRCYKWENECHHCPNLNGYPKSIWLDNSRSNYHTKKKLFMGHKNLTIVAPSLWLARHLGNSFLKEYNVRVIHNGIDLSVFRPTTGRAIIEKYGIPSKKYILGIARIWDKRKGLADFIKLREQLPDSINITLVGLTKNQVSELPDGFTGIARTENTDELAVLYSEATAFINPTYVDNFPTTNLEAMACGTPVITYRTGGSHEAVDKSTGFVIEQGDISGILSAVMTVIENGKDIYAAKCRQRAEKLYNKNDRFLDYLNLYETLIK